MVAQDRITWDRHYRQQLPDYPAPDPLLLTYAPPATPPARALDLASGVGQNGLWLATQGYTVDLLDISRAALEIARQQMNARRLRHVNLLHLDLDRWGGEPHVYDLACVFRYWNPALLPHIKRTLKPTGCLIYEIAHDGRSSEAARTIAAHLHTAFDSWQRLHWDDAGPATRLVVRKPRP